MLLEKARHFVYVVSSIPYKKKKTCKLCMITPFTDE